MLFTPKILEIIKIAENLPTFYCFSLINIKKNICIEISNIYYFLLIIISYIFLINIII